MTNPITPPPELVQQWFDIWQGSDDDDVAFADFVVVRASQYGADQELEACCEWVSQWRYMVGGNRPEVGLRDARRPKPPSLKEQALEQLACIQTDLNKFGMGISTNTIRRALEQLND